MNYITAFAILITYVSSAHAITLKQAYEKAVDYSTSVKQARLDVKISEEDKTTTLSSILPSVTATSNHTWRDEADVGSFGEGYQKSSYLSLSQALFAGGSEYYGISYANSNVLLSKAKEKSAELDLYLEVAKKFYGQLQLQKEKELLENQKETLDKRIKTLQKRVNIGRNRYADVLSSRAQSARVLADLSRVDGNLATAISDLNNLIGSKENLSDSITISSLVPNPKWLSSIKESPEVKELELQAKGQNYIYKATISGYMPEIDLTGNYYLERAGILEDSEWDVVISASWNLFDGFKDRATRRSAHYQKLKYENELQHTLNNIEQEYNAKLQAFLKNKDTYEKLVKAEKVSLENYNLHQKEYQKGLVNNLDVLRVFDEFLAIQRATTQQEFATKISWVELRTFAGVMP